MSENKDLNSPENENTAEEILEEETAADVSQEPATDELDKELEEIRDYFQQELDKAKADAQEAPDGEDESDDTDEDEPKNENLCLCCGEKEKMEGSDYCEDCHEAMRHYPFKLTYFIVAIFVVIASIFAVDKIAEINTGWVYAYEGDVLASEGMYTSATEKYQYAQNYLYRCKVEPKIVYLHSLETSYEHGGFNVITAFPTSVATLFEEWELNLPHMKTLKKDYMRSQEMLATLQKIQTDVFAEYRETPPEELPYDEIISKISELEDLVLCIGIDENGNELTEEVTEQQSGTVSSSNAVYFKRETKYDTAMIQYFKYYLAYICDRPNEERIGYLEAVKANAPDMEWLYANELGIAYAEKGDKEKALEYADLISSHAEPEIASYYIRSIVAKTVDKDYDKAIEYCRQGNSEYESEELYHQIVINYLLKGDYKQAQKSAQEAYDFGMDLNSVNTLAFCALINKDEEKYKEMEELYKEYNSNLEEDSDKAEFYQSVIDLRDGKKTVEQILEQGGYDLYD